MNGGSLDGAPVVGGMQNSDGADPIGMRERKRLCDEPAQGKSDEREVVEANAVDDFEKLGDEVRHRVGARGFVALTVPDQVVSHDPEMLGEHGRLPLPHPTTQPEPVNQHDRRSLARLLVGGSRAAFALCRHHRQPIPPLWCRERPRETPA